MLLRIGYMDSLYLAYMVVMDSLYLAYMVVMDGLYLAYMVVNYVQHWRSTNTNKEYNGNNPVSYLT